MVLYTIFMQKVANQLEERGFKVVKIAPNKKNPHYVVYYFEDTVEFRDALREVLAK